MENFNYAKGMRELGTSYLGNVATSAKIKKSLYHGTMTYCVYLAPYDMAGNGINVCPNGEHCHASCLNKSGRNKSDILSRGEAESIINNSRIKKTRFFYEDRETFMQILIAEIRRAFRRASRLGYEFSVRLNGTSDLSPEAFRYGGKNILEIFPDVTFYDYSKRPHAIVESDRYDNYYVTFSYDGYNWDVCQSYLERGGNVAVVFYGDELPETYRGWDVIDGNNDDTRYADRRGCVVGLHYHVTADDYYVDETTRKRKCKKPDTRFVVFNDDEYYNR